MPNTGSTDSQGRVDRFDRGELRASHRTAEGFLLAQGYVAKPGVMLYRRADGSIVRELIPDEELHRQDSLGTLGRKPVTLNHPATGEDVTPGNVAELGVGDLDSEIAVVEGGYVRVQVALRRADAIEAVERGTRELSPGYSCRIDATPGVHPVYGEYDAIQRDRRYNHVAVVDVARGGPEIHLRADSAIQVERTAPPPVAGADMDPKILIEALVKSGVSRADAESLVTSEAARADGGHGVKAALDAMLEKYDGLTRERDKLQAKLDEMMAEMEQMKAKAVEAEKPAEPGEEAKKADADAKMAFFAERLPLVKAAETHKLDAAQVAAMDNAALRKALVLALNPKARTDAVDSYYEVALEMLQARDERTDGREVNPYESGTITSDTRADAAAATQPSAVAWSNAIRKLQSSHREA